MEDVIRKPSSWPNAKARAIASNGTCQRLGARRFTRAARSANAAHQVMRAHPETTQSRAVRSRPGRIYWRGDQQKGKSPADAGTILDEMADEPCAAIKLRGAAGREFEPWTERSHRWTCGNRRPPPRLRRWCWTARFRKIFLCLNVIPIEMPPLRNRREDIPVLADHFVRKHQQRTGKHIERIDDGVHEKLAAYEWPGNVRELENTIERAVVLSTNGIISVASISVLGVATGPSSALPSLKLRTNIEWIEQETIRRALDSAGGVKKDAADLMGISQRALIILAKYNSGRDA